MEYIDKRKAWTALKAEAESHELPASKEAYKRAARIIDQMPTVQIMEWVSCEERMPEPDTLVIVACYGSDIIIPHNGETLTESIERVQREHVTVTLGFIGSDGWYGCDYFPMMITPTCWQPLPEPPKGE